MRIRRGLLLAAIVLFIIGAAGVPLAINAIPLGLACFAASHLYGH